MEQKEKELLLRDLCARLPYGVDLQINKKVTEQLYSIGKHKNTEDWFVNGVNVDLIEIKPYLRPMSSMTEQEQEEFVKFHCVNICSMILTDMLTLDNESKMFDWLNVHHFDYRGLIEKRLALEAPEGMYNTKTE